MQNLFLLIDVESKRFIINWWWKDQEQIIKYLIMFITLWQADKGYDIDQAGDNLLKFILIHLIGLVMPKCSVYFNIIVWVTIHTDT